MAFILLKNFLSICHLKLIGLIGPRAVSERVKPTLWHLTLNNVNCVTWTCNWLDWFSFIIITIIFSFSHLQMSPRVRVSSVFFLSVVLSSGGLPFTLC